MVLDFSNVKKEDEKIDKLVEELNEPTMNLRNVEKVKLKEHNTKLLMSVATYMAEQGIIDISYNELKVIIEKIEND